MINLAYAPEIDVAYTRGASLLELRQKLIQASRSGRRTRAEADWAVNLKWYSGEPWFRQNEFGGVDEQLPQYRSRGAPVNLSFEVVETLAGKMTYPPRVEAVASSPDPEDIFRARATADIGNHAVFVSGLYEAFAEAVKIVHICGYSWIKYGWDPSTGPQRPVEGQVVCPTCNGIGGVPGWYDQHLVPCPQCSAQGVVLDDGFGTGKVNDVVGEMPQGELFADNCPPWEIAHEPGLDDLTKCRKINHRKVMSRAEAWLRYAAAVGLDEEDLSAAQSTDDDFGGMSWRIGSMWEKQMGDDLVAVDEYWELPSQSFPRGLYGILIGDVVIRFGALPYANTTTLPFVPFTGYKIPGVSIPKSTMDFILPLVFILNEHISALHQRAKMTAKLRVLSPDLSHVKLDDDQVVVKYKHRAGVPPPRELQFGSAPSDASGLIEMFKEFTDRISGAAAVFRGQAPAGAESARAFAWLDEQALTRMTPMVDRHARSLLKVIQGLVELVQIFYEEGRTLQSFGTQGAVENREFLLSDVGPSKDIRMNAVRDLLRSKAARMGDLLESQKVGGLQDPVFMKLAEFGSDNPIQRTQAMHEGAALQENQTLKRYGFINPPIEGENHPIHTEMIDRLINELRTSNPGSPLLPMALEHRRGHKMLEAQEAVQAQMDQQMAAAQYGAANAANGMAQPAAAQAGAQQANGSAAAPAVQNPQMSNISGAGAPGTQPSIQAADERAIAGAQQRTPA